MATDHRLFVDAPLELSQAIVLPQQASHYLTRVLRLRPGAQVTLFNGDGNNYAADLLSADKNTAELKVKASNPGPNATPRLHLALALLKGDKLDFALQKATELDVTTIWLTQTNRCELRLTEKRKANRMLHWRRIIVSACEQSGRTRIPVLHPPQSLAQVLQATQGTQRYSLEPSAGDRELSIADQDVCLFTGPEGGFDIEEARLLASQSTCVQIGELILRAETAPIAGLALLGAARRATINRTAT